MGPAFFTGENSVIYKTIKYLFGGIFLVSGITKIFSYQETVLYFAGLLNVSTTILGLLLTILILLEVTISVLAWWDMINVKIIFILVEAVLIMFLVMNLLFLFQGIENCGCFGAVIQNSPLASLLKTVILILAGIYLHKNRSSQNPETRQIKI